MGREQEDVNYCTYCRFDYWADGVEDHGDEGMQIRNWMRRQEETANKGDHYYDDNWTSLVEMAIGE
jgi:hypothetical protein